MDYYAGIDVSLEASSVCVVDGAGKIVKEAKVLSEPADLIAWFKALPFALTRIGLEAVPLSAMKLAERAGYNKATVALARKLAVILHRMLADGKPFDAAKAAA